MTGETRRIIYLDAAHSAAQRDPDFASWTAHGSLPIRPRGSKQTADAFDERLRPWRVRRRCRTHMFGGVVAYEQVARADARSRGIYSDFDMREAVCVCIFSVLVSFLNDALCV